MADIVITERRDMEDYSFMKVEAVSFDGVTMSNGTFQFVRSSYGEGQIKTLLAGGIGTPVQYRRSGNIRKMFEVMHNMAAKEGAAVALLHPFSFAYYRKFGYEKVSDHMIVRCPTRCIDFVSRECHFVPYDDSRLDDLIKVYERFSKGRNLLLPRVDARNYSSAGKQAYVCYKEGEPIAYVVYSAHSRLIVNHMGEGLLTVHELAYTSPEALREIFSFLRMFEGEFDEIEFSNIAMCPEVEMLLRHYTHTTYTLVPDIMARVLNTEALLRANDYPSREGAFTVAVEDSMDTVAGTYRVEFGGGNCCVARVEGGADLTLSAPAFVRLAYGYDGANVNTAKYMDGVQIDGNAEDFFRAFSKKPCGVFEHF